MDVRFGNRGQSVRIGSGLLQCWTHVRLQSGMRGKGQRGGRSE